MKSIVDVPRTTANGPEFREEFLNFAKEACFEPKACIAYRPCTKGKVETLARLMERLRVYNEEIETSEDIEKIVKSLNEDLNNEICQGTGKTPAELFEKEKEYLTNVNAENLKSFLSSVQIRKVSNESLVTYKGKKYSVQPKYIGKSVEIREENNKLLIFYDEIKIQEWNKSEKLYNYKHDHYLDILQNGSLKDLEEDEIKKIAERNLNIYDQL